jgi:transposase
MSMKRKTYTEDFKAQAVDLLVNSGKPVSQIGRELGVSDKTLWNWKEKLAPEVQKVRGKSPVSEADKEILQLRKQIKILEMEREILKKAAAFFAKEQFKGLHLSLRRRPIFRFLYCAASCVYQLQAITSGGVLIPASVKLRMMTLQGA